MLTISIRPSPCASWHVCQHGLALFSDLPLERAIRLAREAARDQRQRLRRPVCVDMPGTNKPIVLARYAPIDGRLASHAQVA